MPFRNCAVAALTAAVSIAVPAAARAADVSIANKAFGPTGVTIASGESGPWHWGDGVHNVHVIQGPEQFDSGFKSAGAAYTRQLSAAGVYTYQCDAHPAMRGQVTVTGAAVDAAAPRLASVRVSALAVVRLTASAPGRLEVRV